MFLIVKQARYIPETCLLEPAVREEALIVNYSVGLLDDARRQETSEIELRALNSLDWVASSRCTFEFLFRSCFHLFLFFVTFQQQFVNIVVVQVRDVVVFIALLVRGGRDS